MTRDEYIANLKDALAFMEDDARDAALTFYTEMLDDRMEDGMDEAAAVDAMDSPEAIAQRLKCEQEKAADREGVNMGKIIAAMGDYARQAAEDVIEATEGIISGANTFANAAIGRAEGAYHAIRDEIKKGENGDYDQHFFTCPAEGIGKICLTARDMPIRIMPCSDDQIHLTYYSCEEDPYTVTVENGVLTLWHQGDIRRRLFRFSLFKKTPAVELSAPENILADLSVATTNASIQLTGLQALCDTDLETSNGRIAVEDTQCKSLNMKTSNALLMIHKVKSKTFIRGKTSNGRMEGEFISAGSEVHLSTSNGRAYLNGGASQGALSLITSNGAIEVYDLSAAQVILRTSNGGVRGLLPGPITDWEIDSATSNGRNSLPSYMKGEKPLSVHTFNGNIDIQFTDP